jgi:hypothetical protein
MEKDLPCGVKEVLHGLIGLVVLNANGVGTIVLQDDVDAIEEPMGHRGRRLLMAFPLCQFALADPLGVRVARPGRMGREPDRAAQVRGTAPGERRVLRGKLAGLMHGGIQAGERNELRGVSKRQVSPILPRMAAARAGPFPVLEGRYVPAGVRRTKAATR